MKGWHAFNDPLSKEKMNLNLFSSPPPSNAFPPNNILSSYFIPSIMFK